MRVQALIISMKGNEKYTKSSDIKTLKLEAASMFQR
jgi:hypothetical protein